MYSIPPGGFRHPYPALAMNASMSRWVSAGTRDPSLGIPELAAGFWPLLRGRCGTRPRGSIGSGCSRGDPALRGRRPVPGGRGGLLGQNQPRECAGGPHGWGKSGILWAQGIAYVGSVLPSCTSWGGIQRKTRPPAGLKLVVS